MSTSLHHNAVNSGSLAGCCLQSNIGRDIRVIDFGACYGHQSFVITGCIVDSKINGLEQVPGRNAYEIKMFHQEDAGLNVEMAKLAFAKGIWSYVCKMDNALHKYFVNSHLQTGEIVYAVTLIQKVPLILETVNSTSSPVSPTETINGLYTGEAKENKLYRRPSKKVVAKGLLLLGGAICLSRGHSALGAKVAMAYILTKLYRCGASTRQNGQGSR